MSTSPQALKQASQTVARLERQLARHKIKARKADTRNKIQLGGLVIKAKMHTYSKAVILGALLSTIDEMKRDPKLESVFKLKGEAAFLNYGV